MASTISTDAIEKGVIGALQAEVSRIAEEEIAEAQKRVEERVQAQIGTFATRILSQYSMSMHGNIVRIEVDLAATKSGTRL